MVLAGHSYFKCYFDIFFSNACCGLEVQTVEKHVTICDLTNNSLFELITKFGRNSLKYICVMHTHTHVCMQIKIMQKHDFLSVPGWQPETKPRVLPNM